VKTVTIYCNADLSQEAAALLCAEVEPHELLAPAGESIGVLGRGRPDPLLARADVAFGQPDVDQIIACPRLAWVQLTSAGYAHYDRADLYEAFRERGAALTKSSLVFDEPCALHLLAFMCGQARQLAVALDSQRGTRGWPQTALRARSRLLRDQAAVVVGFGSIGRRLVEMLAPLHMRLSAIRRRVVGDEPVPTYQPDDPRAREALGDADHVIDVLPDSPSTRRFFDARRIAQLKAGAVFYNIGRGSTVDQEALREALESDRLAAAYLDVTVPEPLPPEHPLWSAPHCFITPHTGGGHAEESVRLVRHFLDNLARFTVSAPLLDRVV
jgi:phosphoglycerate dehydrogenase-like enzyme